MTAVGEHWSRSLVNLAEEAGQLALDDAQRTTASALVIGNAYGATLNQQTQLGSLLAQRLQLGGCEAFTCEAGDAAGGVALRTGILLVMAGLAETALVIGVEKMTDTVGPARSSARNVSLDTDYEAVNGATQTALAALLMRRYMHEYGSSLADFAGFSENAHRNGARNPKAMFRNSLRPGAYVKAPTLADPINLFDSAPEADGAAAVLLARADLAQPRAVQVAGSAVATDSLTLQERSQPLYLRAVQLSTQRALFAAGLDLQDLDLLELHDATTIQTTLTLEAMGLSAAGTGWRWAKDAGARIALHGDLPLSTFGGLKSRGHPGGATGIYQAVEATLQLRGDAAANQVPGAQHALIQSMGGIGATVATHILCSESIEGAM